MGLFDTPQDNQQQSIFDTIHSSSTPQEAVEAATNYKRISPWAIIAFILAIPSLLAFVSPGFIFLSWIAMAVALAIALWIHFSKEEITGESFALAGLFVAIIPAIAVPASKYIYDGMLIRQGQEFADSVFDAIKQGDTFKFKQLQEYSPNRQLVKHPEDYWDAVMDTPMTHDIEHSRCLSQPVALVIYNFRGSIKLTYIRTFPIQQVQTVDLVPMLYAATYTNQEGKTETFFFTILLRHAEGKEGLAYWAWKELASIAVSPDIEVPQYVKELKKK